MSIEGLMTYDDAAAAGERNAHILAERLAQSIYDAADIHALYGMLCDLATIGWVYEETSWMGAIWGAIEWDRVPTFGGEPPEDAEDPVSYSPAHWIEATYEGIYILHSRQPTP